MTTNTKQVSSPRKVQVPGIIARAGYFIWHLIEMCLAMCIGGIPLIVLFFVGAGKIGYPDLFQQSPELSVLVIGFILAVPMIAWMRFRGHEWRSTVEMASTTIVLAVLLVGLGWLGILAKTSLIEWMRTLACPVMIIPMLFRLDQYTAHHANHSRHQMHAADSADEAACH
jgi:biotin transporter BioY